jgi:mannose-6-phosphate isomerase
MMSIEIEEHSWERFFIVHDQPTYKLIRKKVDAGGKLSYHYHQKPSEAWTIVEGTREITLDSQDN